MEKITLSCIKADVGGYVGHGEVHPDMLARSRELLSASQLLVDFHVTRVGDDINLIMTHRQGVDSSEIHRLAWDTFQDVTEVAKRLKLYGAGQDLLVDAFSGNVRGLGPGVCEMEFEERPSEPFIVFMADKTEPGAWNLPLFKIFADPFNTPGLVIDNKMHKGFDFVVHNLKENAQIRMSCPEELYDLLMFIGAPHAYVIKEIYSRELGEITASATTTKLALIAGRYVGKDDPSLIVRCQSGLPAVGEALEPFAWPHFVGGWMRGSHCGPLMPCALEDARPSRLDGPPRVVALGFQLAEGRLVGPRDMFADSAWDKAREMANEMAYVMRRHGPFEPHRLGLDEMEYTTMPQIMKRLAERWEPIPGPGETAKELVAAGQASATGDGSEIE
ncbi:MAG TPA: fructose-1,6-bisphosphate aldolase/phosphatase [Chloroflexota bacterium]|nr:fructose-1,6-bisphosphate aldolase/phosphatase [Chloroflexota bacterium]